MVIKDFRPPFYSMLWRPINHVLFDWCDTKYYIYYTSSYNKVSPKKEKIISQFKSDNYERKKTPRQRCYLIIIKIFN